VVVWVDGPIACEWPQVGLTKGAVVAQKPSNLFYGVQDIPPFGMTLLLGLQHVMVMSVTLILPVLIVQAMGGTPAQAQSLIRMSLIAGGIGTILQALHKGPIGSGYLCPQLSGPAYLSTSLLAAQTGGLSLVFGMTVIAGCFEALLSRVVYRLRALFPTEVTGLVVVMVGLALVPVGVSNFVGMTSPATVSETPVLLVACLTLACMDRTECVGQRDPAPLQRAHRYGRRIPHGLGVWAAHPRPDRPGAARCPGIGADHW